MLERMGKNSSDNRRINRGLVTKIVATGGCTTRSELVRETGLSKMTISNIVSELMEFGILEEKEVVRNEEPGRNPIRLVISPDAPKVAGLAISRDRCECILCDLNLHVLKREKATMEDMTEERLIQTIYQLLDTVLFQEENVAAVGVASVGPISIASGMILKPFYFFGIENFNIVQIIQERYHLPVFLDHDNQSALLAESLYGNARGYHDVLFIGISEGVGCGIISDGQLYCNRRGLPPEMGHVSIDANGKPCQCGNKGCLETYIRSPELLKKLRYHTGKYYTYEAFGKLEGNKNVDMIFQDAVEKLATAVVSTINILNSELILLGNDSVYWKDHYVAELEEEINRRRFVEWDEPVLVKKAYFMQDASLFGAACNAVVQIFSGKLTLERRN